MVTVASLWMLAALTDLHITEVADLHSEVSHPVLPVLAVGVFPSPKFDPSTNRKVDPENQSAKTVGLHDTHLTASGQQLSSWHRAKGKKCLHYLCWDDFLEKHQ
jgi:hypothetical protein